MNYNSTAGVSDRPCPSFSSVVLDSQIKSESEDDKRGRRPAMLPGRAEKRAHTLHGIGMLLSCLVVVLFCRANADPTAQRFFDQGIAAAKEGDSQQAFHMFGDSLLIQPASGTLHNFGNAAWRVGQPGPAVLAWEQALWLDPRNEQAQTSLRYARHTGDLEEPDLRWYEVCSSWLPAQWWPWLAAGSFWGSVSLLILPSVSRRARRDGYQALAAACAAVFLLCLHALAGLNSRAKLGFIIPKEAALRVTPTAEAQVLTYLPSGLPARLQRTHGEYVLIRTRYSSGWVTRDELGPIGWTHHTQ